MRDTFEEDFQKIDQRKTDRKNYYLENQELMQYGENITPEKVTYRFENFFNFDE